ncbi:MAG: hypothetical protein FJ034_00795, partial [Chloroflexi bacterium]|nr:hypothetical protein [Chloroflexota bacterium]
MSIAANVRALAIAVGVAFLVTSLGVGRWMLFEAPRLARDSFNPRLVAAAADGPRGPILARDGTPLAVTVPAGVVFRREYLEPSLAHVVGYVSAQFGLAGLESAYAGALAGRDPADELALLRQRYLGQQPTPGSLVTGIDLAGQRAAALAL